jgi:hypothetical protein
MPSPRDGESQSDFIHRCVPVVMNEGTTDDNKQAVAICGSMWRRAHGQKSASLFSDLIKDATSQSVHVPASLGSISTAYGQKERDDKKVMFDEMIAGTSAQTQAKDPDVGVEPDEDDEEHDAVHGDMEGITTHDEPDDDEDPLDKQWSVPFKVHKALPEQRLIFGWASVVEKDGKPVIDHQGDMIPVEELEKAAYDYVLNSRQHDDMHEVENVGKMIESYVATKDKPLKLDGQDQVGWWVGFHVEDDAVWEAHKRGERSEFSIRGRAKSEEIP